MRPDAAPADADRVIAAVAGFGGAARVVQGQRGRVTLAVTGGGGPADGAQLVSLPGVDEVFWGGSSYYLASREWHPDPTVVRFPGGVTVGGDQVVLIAGPCAVESEEQILATAHRLAASGVQFLRGGAFKPRTSPYAFQGLGQEALRLLARARGETGLLIVTEALDSESVDQVAEVADVLQVGARNMVNYPLLRRVGRAGRPVLLKRGMASTVQELLLAAEYVLAEGNPDVILCERGVRGFDGSTRNVFDVSAIPLLHHLSHLPVIADPSHGTGRRDLVPPMARAAVAAGADGVMIEVHPHPDLARSDGAQSLALDDFPGLVVELRRVAEAVGRSVASGVPSPR
ncbi:MAG TPA: 3-deoxy-7-phosphoheptulonate synthase [Gemmatimonadales bacterium]